METLEVTSSGERQSSSEEMEGQVLLLDQGSVTFSQMSYEEINETINNSGPRIHDVWDNFDWNLSADLDIMGWQNLEMQL